MNQQELEDLYIRSLDMPMTNEEKEKFLKELHAHPDLAKRLSQHKKVRDLLIVKTPASFGPYFAAKLMNKIENTGIVIDRQLFSFFKKFQLAALGAIVVLLILNILFTEQISIKSILGLDRTEAPTTEETVVSFDFFKTLNENL
jgi:hypothetical protein